jgi:hypothetical protein
VLVDNTLINELICSAEFIYLCVPGSRIVALESGYGNHKAIYNWDLERYLLKIDADFVSTLMAWRSRVIQSIFLLIIIFTYIELPFES